VSLTFWPWSHVTWCILCGQALCQVWCGYYLPFQSDDDYNNFLWPSAFFWRGGLKNGYISNFIILTPKRHYLVQNEVKRRIVRGGASKDATCGQRGQKLSRVKLAICPEHACQQSPLKFACGICTPGVSWISVKGSQTCGGRKSPSPIDLVHTGWQQPW